MNLTVPPQFASFSKVNFFDRIKEKAPKAMEAFSIFIDSYKSIYDWKLLFGGDLVTPPKFHDLPYSMQYGIMLEFFALQGKVFLLTRTDTAAFFEGLFLEIENEITPSRTKEIVSQGANQIFMERLRQINLNGYDVDWDKRNDDGELTKAAMWLITLDDQYYPSWWSKKWCDKWREKSPKERKIAAGALIAADLDREIEEEKLIPAKNEG